MCLSSLVTIEECAEILRLNKPNSIYKNNFEALKITINDIIEEVEKYLNIESR